MVAGPRILPTKRYTHLRKDLAEPPQAPRFPADVCPVPFDPASHARAAHALLEKSYRSGGGTVDAFDPWWYKLVNDPEYDPGNIFTAVDTTGRLAGIALCWNIPFVKDLAVAPAWQRQGLGEALLRQAFVFFHERGEPYIDLKVHDDNPAMRLYRRLGMRPA